MCMSVCAECHNTDLKSQDKSDDQQNNREESQSFVL